MLAVAAAALILTAWFYHRAFHAIGFRRWRTLYLLRAAAVLIVVTLLFQPVLSYQKERSDKPALIFLLDASASMGIADDESGRQRFDLARAKLEEWTYSLARNFRMLTVAFADRALPLDDREQLAALIPNGEATSLSRALEAGARQLAPAELEAIVLLSDGIHNLPGNPAETAARLGATVHCVGVGASLRGNRAHRDVQVVGIDCPGRMMLGNVARVTGSIDAVGLANRVVQVFLDEDGRQAAEAQLTLDDVEGAQQVAFEFTPEAKGRRSYTVRVPPAAGERIVENNSRSAVAVVHQAEISVLYVEGTLRAEYGALVDRFLSKDPDLEFCALVQTRPNVFLQRTNMSDLRLTAIPADRETIDRFDVFIIGDLDASYIRPEQQRMILDRVNAGAGLAMLGGYRSLGPGGYAGTTLGDALPVILGNREIGQHVEQFLPTLTPEGARHPIFANIADFFPTRGGPPQTPGLPPLLGCTRVERARPDASVLATLGAEPDAISTSNKSATAGLSSSEDVLHRNNTAGQASSGTQISQNRPAQRSAMPVLAVRPVGRGRTAVFTGDTTRNWQQVSQALDRESPFLRFWGQMVRWLANREAAVEASAGVAADTDKAQYELEQPVRISAVVRDEQGRAAANAQVTAEIKGPGGRNRRIDLAPVPGPEGHFQAAFEPPAAGRYEIAVEARLEALTLAAPIVPVEVGRLNLEFERLDLDERTLMDIAAAAGGSYAHLSTADHFIAQLERQQRTKTVFVERRLYWPPALWTLLVAALTCEWILRRRYQLR